MAEIKCGGCGFELEKPSICPECGWDNSDAEVIVPEIKTVDGKHMNEEDLKEFESGNVVVDFPSDKKSNKPQKKKESAKKNTNTDKMKSKSSSSDKNMKNKSNNPDLQNVETDNADLSVESLNNLSSDDIADGVYAPEENPPTDESAAGNKKKRSLIKSVLKIVIIILISAVLFLLGFFVSKYYNSNLYINQAHDTAVKSVNAVLTKLPSGSKFILYDVYVKFGTDITECIIFAAVSSSFAEYTGTNYRLLIDNHNPENTTLYYAFDPEKYNTLKNGTPEEQVTASVMMSHYDNFKRSLKEVETGTNGWIKASAPYINLLLNG